jgi:hypothetical protein
VKPEKWCERSKISLSADILGWTASVSSAKCQVDSWLINWTRLTPRVMNRKPRLEVVAILFSSEIRKEREASGRREAPFVTRGLGACIRKRHKALAPSIHCRPYAVHSQATYSDFFDRLQHWGGGGGGGGN